MGIFSFVENFFFISLGITFVLILLLVYHFKQRMASVERKGETMFELMSSVVKEINVIKNVNSYYERFFSKSSPNVNTESSVSDAEVDTISYNIVDPIETVELHNQQTNAISLTLTENESDSEEDSVSESGDSGEEESKDSLSSDDDSDEDDSDDESDDGSLPTLIANDTDVVHRVPIGQFSNIQANDILILDEYNTSLEKHIPIVRVSDDDAHIEMDVEIVADQLIDPPADSNASPAALETEPEASGDLEIESEPTYITDELSRRDGYRKMSVNQLKTVVQSLGMQVDVSKMKKIDILRLLETTASSSTAK